MLQGGVHIQQRNEELPPEMVALMKSQDTSYIKYHRDLSKKVEFISVLRLRRTYPVQQKIAKLQESMHFLDEALAAEDDDMLDVYDDEDGQDEEDAKPKKSNHIVFVDDEKSGTKRKTERVGIRHANPWQCSQNL